MKISIGQIFGQISLGTRLFLHLCLLVTVFIGVCTGIFIAFISFLSFLSDITKGDGRFVGGAWLSLLIFYIIFGVAFTRFNARLIRGSFGSEELHVQRRIGALSGLPFYVLCSLFLMTSIIGILSPAPDVDVCASMLLVSVPGFFGFGLVSFSYLLLIRFFLGRLAVIAHQ